MNAVVSHEHPPAIRAGAGRLDAFDQPRADQVGAASALGLRLLERVGGGGVVEVERRVGSSDKLYQLTNYKPETTLTAGLRKIYQTNYN